MMTLPSPPNPPSKLRLVLAKMEHPQTQKTKGAYINLVFSFSRSPLIFISGPPLGLWSILDFIFAAFGFLLFFRVPFHRTLTSSRIYLKFLPHFPLILSACKQLVCFHFTSLLLQFYWLDFKSIGVLFCPILSHCQFQLPFAVQRFSW